MLRLASAPEPDGQCLIKPGTGKRLGQRAFAWRFFDCRKAPDRIGYTGTESPSAYGPKSFVYKYLWELDDSHGSATGSGAPGLPVRARADKPPVAPKHGEGRKLDEYRPFD